MIKWIIQDTKELFFFHISLVENLPTKCSDSVTFAKEVDKLCNSCGIAIN
jgi:hypothetical protein